MVVFDGCINHASTDVLEVLFLHLFPFLPFDAIAVLCPVVANHAGQFSGQGMVPIAAAHQVMGQVVLILFQAHGYCARAWGRWIPGMCLAIPIAWHHARSRYPP